MQYGKLCYNKRILSREISNISRKKLRLPYWNIPYFGHVIFQKTMHSVLFYFGLFATYSTKRNKIQAEEQQRRAEEQQRIAEEQQKRAETAEQKLQEAEKMMKRLQEKYQA